LTLLLLAEHVLDHANLNERHSISPVVSREIAVGCGIEIVRFCRPRCLTRAL
jgi:hypothetical protein